MIKIRTIPTIAVAALLLAACSGAAQTEPPEDFGLTAADVERITQPAVTKEQAQVLVEGMKGFAFDFYKAQPAGENLVFSPHSLAQAFSMLYAGARGTTAEEIAAVFGFLPDGSQHPAFNVLDLRLNDRPANLEEGAEPFTLNIANSAWAQDGFSIEEDFLQILGLHYGAGIHRVDFSTEPDATAERINRWVSDETQERIPELFGPNDIKSSTRLVIANAIYFKGQWEAPFLPSLTAGAPFHLSDGAIVTVDMMQTSAFLAYSLTGQFQAVRLPYRGSTIEMLVLVPNSGQFNLVESQLSSEFLAKIPFARGKIDLRMPRWDFESRPDLMEILPRMGMPTVFGGGADLSGIAPGLFIGAAVHQANISVDEAGTEAAAATGIALEESGPEAAIVIDRPFIFIIINRDTGAILFMGRVFNPVD
ncbi:MAG TPA: serpin family protein [Anaerolineales bacterium]|nr:serpin family protein [Anaerolineales bacterium]